MTKPTKNITVEPIPNSNIKIIEKGQINTHNILIHDRSLSWLITVPSIKIGGLKLVLLAQISSLREMMRPCKFSPNVIKMPALTYNQANSTITKNAIILNIIHNIFNLRDTEVVVCILLILLKQADNFNNI